MGARKQARTPERRKLGARCDRARVQKRRKEKKNMKKVVSIPTLWHFIQGIRKQHILRDSILEYNEAARGQAQVPAAKKLKLVTRDCHGL